MSACCPLRSKLNTELKKIEKDLRSMSQLKLYQGHLKLSLAPFESSTVHEDGIAFLPLEVYRSDDAEGRALHIQAMTSVTACQYLYDPYLACQ